MKKILILLFYILIHNVAFAQKEKSIEKDSVPQKRKIASNYKHEIGVETGTVLSQAFRLFGLVRDTQTFPISPYLAFYKFQFANNQVVRLGVGGSFNKNEEQVGGFADTKTITKSVFDVRLGYENQIPLSTKWTLMLGADALWGKAYETREFDSGFDKAIKIINSNLKGGAFVTSIRYNFTPKISIGSEMSLSFIVKNTDEKDEFSSNPVFNRQVRTSVNTSTRFLGPANVYMSVRF